MLKNNDKRFTKKEEIEKKNRSKGSKGNKEVSISK